MTRENFWQHVFSLTLTALLKGDDTSEELASLAAVADGAADSALDEFTIRGFPSGEAPVLTARHVGKAKSRLSKGE